MTIRAKHILVVTFVLALVHQASRVDAGLMSVGLAAIEGDSPLIAGDDFGAEGANSGSSAVLQGSKQQHRHKAIYDMPQLAVDFACLNGGVGPSTGMSAPQPELAGGASMVALALHSHLGEFPMVAWLGAEARSSLPPPLGTRLMRPPRFAG
jgi:hypothetical protein